MNLLKRILLLIFFLFAAFLLISCSSGSSDEEAVAVIVALTPTAAVQEAEVVATPEVTEPPEAAFPGDLQPLDSTECDQLAAFMVNRLPVPPIEQKVVAVEHNGEHGGGCQAIAVGTGEVFPDMMVVEEAMRGIMGELSWTEDTAAPVCLGTGGWGPGASSSCYFQADALCEVFVHVDPIDDTLCSNDEPIFVCFEGLEPEQIVYTVEVTCARDISP
jgi:hypothetical protein